MGRSRWTRSTFARTHAQWPRPSLVCAAAKPHRGRPRWPAPRLCIDAGLSHASDRREACRNVDRVGAGLRPGRGAALDRPVHPGLQSGLSGCLQPLVSRQQGTASQRRRRRTARTSRPGRRWPWPHRPAPLSRGASGKGNTARLPERARRTTWWPWTASCA